jgi:hypothetical protein
VNYYRNPSDEEIEYLKQRAKLGDEEALKDLIELGIEKPPPPPIPPPRYRPSYTKSIEIDVSLTIDDVDHELGRTMVECEYDIEGEDRPGNYWEPPEYTVWELCAVRLEDQDQIDDYNHISAEEGYPPFPLKVGDDIYPYLSSNQVSDIERELESIDREPDIIDPPDDYYPDDYFF